MWYVAWIHIPSRIKHHLPGTTVKGEGKTRLLLSKYNIGFRETDKYKFVKDG